MNTTNSTAYLDSDTEAAAAAPSLTAVDSQPEEAEEFVADLADAFEDIPDEEEFESLDALFAAEQAEMEGRWVHWAALPEGNEVLIAHISAAEAQREIRERKYRSKKGRPYGKPLHPNPRQSDLIDAELWVRSFFGSVVKDWRGPDMPEFTEREFLRLYGTADRKLPGLRRFRRFVNENARLLEAIRGESEEAARGN